MTYRSWPIFLVVLMLIPPFGGIALAQKREDAARKQSWECTKKQTEFERTLGTLRQYPDAEIRFALAHRSGEKPDFPVCYNMRERLKRDIEIDQWRQTNAPECRVVFREREAKLDRDAKERGRPRKSIKERIAQYNGSCSHTMAGTL
jgi:hypothetical protein